MLRKCLRTAKRSDLNHLFDNYDEFLFAQFVSLLKNELQLDLQIFSCCCLLSSDEFFETDMKLRTQGFDRAKDYELWVNELVTRGFRKNPKTTVRVEFLQLTVEMLVSYNYSLSKLVEVENKK